MKVLHQFKTVWLIILMETRVLNKLPLFTSLNFFKSIIDDYAKEVASLRQDLFTVIPSDPNFPSLNLQYQKSQDSFPAFKEPSYLILHPNTFKHYSYRFDVFGRARSHGKKFPKLIQISFKWNRPLRSGSGAQHEISCFAWFQNFY